MPYRELTMIDVKEVLRRWQAGHSARKIEKETGTDRKTVARYAKYAAELGLPRDRPLTDDDVHAVAQCVQARPLPSPSEEWQQLAERKEKIEAWLQRDRPLRLTKIHRLLEREGVSASYPTLRRFAITELGWHQKEGTVRIEDGEPAQEAQVDFGCMGLIIDAETQHRVKLWVLLVTLVYSRYMFVWPTLRQTTAAVCEGLDRAWWFFGGVVHVLIPDNTKAIIQEPDALSPKLTEAFGDYAQARNLFVDPARVRAPKDKARVENQVPYVREDWFDGEEFTSLKDARESAEQWCRDIAGARIHGTTRKVPREVYEAIEKPLMQPAPTQLHDVAQFADPTVHPDYHIQVFGGLYSVPERFKGKQVHVRADRVLVRIYLGTELIKVHPRQLPGGRSTDPKDYPDSKAIYALRNVDALIAKAKERGAHIGTYAERILGGPLPWSRMRQAYSLLRLCDKYGSGRVEAVCQSALAFDVIDVKRITKMLKTPQYNQSAVPDKQRKVVQLTLPRFARDSAHFETVGARQPDPCLCCDDTECSCAVTTNKESSICKKGES